MGWRGALRAIAAESRRQEREAQRRHRELLRHQRDAEKYQALQNAGLEVDIYENRLELLTSVHKEGSRPWDWQQIVSAAPPVEPKHLRTEETQARRNLASYTPTFLDKLLKRVENRRKEREAAVEEGKARDEQQYLDAKKAYEGDLVEWKTQTELARGILGRNSSAYLEAIEQTDPFSDLGALGTQLRFAAPNADTVAATLQVHGDVVIPSETKSLLQSGKISVKRMPLTQFHGLYQDYVCSCIFRVARELFALLPLQWVIVHAESSMLNTASGQVEDMTIVSVAFSRTTFEKLDLDRIDCSDALKNFVHEMKFQKTKGFLPVSPLDAERYSDGAANA